MVFETFRELVHPVLEDPSQIQSIRVLLIGPTFTALRDQTRLDVKKWIKSRHGQSMIRTIKVINSNSLKKKGTSFLNSFKTGKNALHVVVHDEVHYGIVKDGLLNTFLLELVAAKENTSQQLLVLGVSATHAVLERGVAHFSQNHKSAIVDWNALRQARDSRFETPTYIGIESFDYMVDERIGKIKDKRDTSEASDAVCTEYLAALDALEKRSSAPNCKTAAYEVLSELKNAKDGEQDCMAVVRLKTIAHAVDLTKRLKRNSSGICVIGLVDGLGTFTQQVRQYNRSEECVAALTKGVFLIIVVDKLRMGERVPASYRFWDVRCRYRSASKIGSQATFIQDVGRCAGHGKKPAKVFVGVDHHDPRNIKTPDGLLRKSYGEIIHQQAPRGRKTRRLYASQR